MAMACLLNASMINVSRQASWIDKRALTCDCCAMTYSGQLVHAPYLTSWSIDWKACIPCHGWWMLDARPLMTRLGFILELELFAPNCTWRLMCVGTSKHM
jgi:hypothetical protein